VRFTLLLLALALSPTAPARAGNTAQEARVTIRLISTPGRTQQRDRAPKGELSTGDMLLGTSHLRNAVAQFGKPKGALVGRDRYVMTILSPPVARISVEVKLPGGTLRVRGQASLTANVITLQVVGGTGRFAGARGSSKARTLSAKRTLNVYRLRVP
jgi:hypothetical protein